MPELPEVESVRRQLAPVLVGRTVVEVRVTVQRRFLDVQRAAGTRVLDLRRRGKYLLGGLALTATPSPDVDLELVAHLGMTGSFRIRCRDGWEPDAYVRATFVLDDGVVVDFRDVRRFGTLAVVQAGDHRSFATLAALGPEPLSQAFTARGLHAALAATTMPVKPFLLTQRPVAGIGNIYADEALWLARIHPAARRVGRQRAERLWAALREVIAAAVEREGTTFRDYRMVNGGSGRNAAFLRAYGRAGLPCERCGTTLARMVLGGRGTTWCPRCQRR